MRRQCVVLLTLVCWNFSPAYANDNWPGFRGPGGRGVSLDGATATFWNATVPKDPAIAWQTEVPGLGHSSPTIVGERIFLATAVAEQGEVPLDVGRNGNIKAADDNGVQTWMVLCYDKSTGNELWRRIARHGEPKATRHAKATHANTTIAASEDQIIAFFGSEGLYCYDHDGNLLWKRDLGVIDVSKYGTGWGYASSPVVHSNRVVVVCDAPSNPFVAALRVSDGEEVWRRSREGDCERSWGTALVHEADGATQVVVNGWPWIVSYDLTDGTERWRIAGGGDNPVPTPFVDQERIYITNAHGGASPIYAIRSDAQGNLSESDTDGPMSEHVAWTVERGGCYMSTPVIWGGLLYLGNTNGILRCFDSVTGEKVYEKRLGGGVSITASLVAADGKIYCPSEDGKMYVVKAGREFEVLAKNEMGAPCFATPAISDDVLYVRTTKKLIAIQAVEEEVAEPELSRLPNVLFIAVDDLRPSLGCYGDPNAITPNIDALASRGMRFERAYCQVAVCNPSRASLMTGLRPDNLGVWTLPIHFREAKPDAVTIPQWFRKFGYTAVSHGKIFHNPTPDPQSWSEPIRDLPRLPDPYPSGTREIVRSAMEDLPSNDWRKNNLRRPSTAAPDLPDHEVLDGARTSLAIEDLRRLGKQESPFFLAMGYIRPHLAWVAPKKYWDMHDPSELPVETEQQVIDNTPPYAPHNNSELSHYVDLIDMPKPWDEAELSIEKRRQLVHGYYACVTYVDAQIGRLLDALDDEGLADNTIVVLWSDHGWKLGEHRGWGKMTNYEIDARVPLLIASPDTPMSGQSTDQLVELLDLFPTLCDLSGIQTPDFVDGKSLVSLLQGVDQPIHTHAMSQYYRRLNGSEYIGYSMRTDRYRFIEWRDFATGEVTDRELYDHQDGFQEDENIAGNALPETIEDLTEQLVASHPRNGLVMTPAVHSNPNTGRWRADLTFSNETETELRVFPITPKGRRGRVTRIAPKESANISARIGGVFVVESNDGSIHEIHSPSFPQRTVVISHDNATTR